jgi:hypothetical protein
MLAPVDFLLALAPFRFEGVRLDIMIDARGETRCNVIDSNGASTALEPATCAQIADRMSARLIGCAVRHRGLALSVDVDVTGRIVPDPTHR